jgi:hypothetical protein
MFRPLMLAIIRLYRKLIDVLYKHLSQLYVQVLQSYAVIHMVFIIVILIYSRDQMNYTSHQVLSIFVFYSGDSEFDS